MANNLKSVPSNAITYGYVIALAIVMPWSNALFNMLLISGILLFIIGAIRGNFAFSKSYISLPIFGSMILFFIICLMSVLLRKDWDGMAYLNRVAAFAILPFLVFNMAGELSRINGKKILTFYIHSTAILALSTLLVAITRWIITKSQTPLSKSIVYENLSNSLVHHQPIYFAIFVGFALIGLVFILLSEKRKNTFDTNLYLVEALFLLFFLFLLGSRTVILATFLSLFILCLIKSKKVFLVMVLLGGLVFTLNYSYNESFKKRINYVLDFETKFDYKSDWSYEGLALRYMTWNCSISCIEKSPWFGFGITESQNCLDQCYKDNNYHPLLYFAKNNGRVYNSHNLFLDVFVKLGIFGLLVIIAIFLLFLFKAIKTKNLLLILLLVFIGINGVTESILVREKGIIFFSFMLGFLSRLDENNEGDTNQKSALEE